jgi:hypothetical protein
MKRVAFLTFAVTTVAGLCPILRYRNPLRLPRLAVDRQRP